MKKSASLQADTIPDSMPLYKQMARKYPGRNPLLSAVHELHDSQDIDEFVNEYTNLFKKGGENEKTYTFHSRFSKNPPRSREDLVKRLIIKSLGSYKGEMGDTEETRKVVSFWEESLKKL